MKINKRIISILVPLIFITIAAGIIALIKNTPSELPSFNFQFRYSDKEAQKFLASCPKDITIQYHKVGERTVRSVGVIHNENLPTVYFIHGAPGSSGDYYSYLKNDQLLQYANLISIDRPGYGYSDFGRSMISIEKQAFVIQQIIRFTQSKSQRNLLVGHSYGGPIIAKIAMDYPRLAQGIIMLAPAIDPENEKTIRIAHLGNSAPIRWIIPTALRVASDEKVTHISELQKMINGWPDIYAFTCHIHGTKDRLVPFDNLLFSKKVLINAPLETIVLEGEDHFIPWTQRKLVQTKIVEYLLRM